MVKGSGLLRRKSLTCELLELNNVYIDLVWEKARAIESYDSTVVTR